MKVTSVTISKRDLLELALFMKWLAHQPDLRQYEEKLLRIANILRNIDLG